MLPVFGLIVVSSGATGKSAAPAQLLFDAELFHNHYAAFLNNYAC